MIVSPEPEAADANVSGREPNPLFWRADMHDRYANPAASSKMLTRVATLLCSLWIGWSGGATAATDDEIRAAFDQFVKVQNAHDLNALEGLLADSPQFLWITRGMVIWGRDAALKRFAVLYEGTWRLDPELANARVVPIAENVAQLFVPVTFTTGAAGQPPQTSRLFLNQVLVKTGGTWRVSSILPVPAPAP